MKYKLFLVLASACLPYGSALAMVTQREEVSIKRVVAAIDAVASFAATGAVLIYSYSDIVTSTAPYHLEAIPACGVATYALVRGIISARDACRGNRISVNDSKV